jgi:hypothetical protein
MFRLDAPAAGRRAGVMALVVMAGVLTARASFAQAAPAQQAQAAKNPYVFASDGALLLQFIKPDKTADFEMIMSKVKEALMKSDKPERKQQAQGWKLFKAAEAGAGGAAIYVSVIEPALKGADYTVSTIIAEAFPAEANALYKTYVDVFGTPSGNLLNLTLVSDLGK